MVVDIRPLRDDLTNVEWLNAVRNSAGLEYQRNIPEATRANISETVKKIMSNSVTRNQFVDTLVNRIGLTIFQNTIWTNPLAIYKRGVLEYGETIQEIMAGFLEATVYDSDRDDLEKEIFGAMTPEVQASYHSVNRRDKYKLTIKEPLLRNAFLTPNGLGEFVTNLMGMAYNSDQYHEYLLMLNLFREMDEVDEFFTQNVPDVSDYDSGTAESRALLRRLKEFGNLFQFPSRLYNPARLPVVASPQESVLIVTAKADAAMDVEALAGAFNLSKTEFMSRKIVVPGDDLGIPGTEAILTTDKFFVVADQRIETTAIQNPSSLFTNYWLHHWQVISASRFAPVIMFNSERESTNIYAITATVDTVTIGDIVDSDGDVVTDVQRGRLFSIDATATMTDERAPIAALIYSVEDAKSEFTRVSNNGVLFVGHDEEATTLTIKVVATTNEAKSATKTVNVVGTLVKQWPVTVKVDDDNDGNFEVVPADLVMVDNKVTIPDVEGVQYKKGGTNVAAGSEHTISSATTFTAVAKSGYELKSGATASWTFGE